MTDDELERLILIKELEATDSQGASKRLQSGSIADPVAQGATLGFSDEIAGAIGAGIGKILPEAMGGLPSNVSMSDAYTGIRDAAREQNRSFSARNPKVAMGAEIAGGVLAGGATGLGAAKALSSLPKYVRYAGAGAVPGAVAGVGYDKTGAIAQPAMSGAVMGAATGAVIPAVANIAKGAVRKMAALISKNDKTGLRKLEEALIRDGVSPEDVQRTLIEAKGLMTIADAAGGNTLGLARASAAFPGQAKNIAEKHLNARNFRAGERLKSSLGETLSETDDVYSMLDRVNDAARKQATPLYKQAYQTPTTFTDELQGLLKRPSVATAWKKAQRIAADEGEDLPQVFKMSDDGERIVGIIDSPNTKAWDYIIRGLDDVVESHTDITGKLKGNIGRGALNLRRQIDDIVKEGNPAFKEAKRVWSGKMGLESALIKGQKLLTDDFDLSKRAIAKLSEGEKEMFRVGVFKALRTKINKAGDGFDVGKRVFGNKDLRDKLELIFPDKKSFKAFEKQARLEQRLYRTKNTVVGGSPTARIEGEKTDMLIDPTFVTRLARGDLMGAGAAAARYGANKMAVPTERTALDLSNILFEKNPMIQQQILKQLHPAERTQLIQQLNARFLGGGNAVTQGLLSQ